MTGRLTEGTRVRFAASCTDVDCPSGEGVIVALLSPATNGREDEYEVEYHDGEHGTYGPFFRSELEVVS